MASRLAEDFVGPAGIPHKAGAWVEVTAPLLLDDGRVAWFPHPNIAALYLHPAKAQRDRGEQLRRRWERSLAVDADGNWHSPTRTDRDALDAVGLLASAVSLSYAAVEAFCNALCEEEDAPEAVTLRTPGRKDRVVQRKNFQRQLSTLRKLELVVPELDGGSPIIGTPVGDRLDELRHLRDELVHVPGRSYSNDLKHPTAFGRLLRGDGSRCVEDAVAAINAAMPWWIGRRMLTALNIDL